MIETVQRNATRLVLAGLAAFAVGFLARRLLDDTRVDPVADLVTGISGALVLVAMFFAYVRPTPLHTGEPRSVHPPVRGRWLAMNSPATKVPSHGVRAYGQSHAVDLVHEPLDGQVRPQFGAGAALLRPEEFPAFGQPVLAMVDGTVVRVRDRQRDQRSRSRMWAVLLMSVEGMLREFRGSDGIIGNHVVIDAGDGTFALVAHLRRGSTTVREGDLVRAGDQIAECGNTGNTSEPHVHAQLMDRARASVARGLPMRFSGASIEAAEGAAGPSCDCASKMPADGEYLLA